MLGSSAHVRIRKAESSDASALADVFRESWLASYRGIIPQLHLETMISRRGAEWWRSALRSGESVMVLEVAEQIGGYATWGVSRGRAKQQGEIYEIYLLPTFQGLGLGERLFEACRHQLDMRKLNGLIVWSLLENKPAIDFYWRRGGRPIAQAYDRIGGSRLEKIGFAWS